MWNIWGHGSGVVKGTGELLVFNGQSNVAKHLSRDVISSALNISDYPAGQWQRVENILRKDHIFLGCFPNSSLTKHMHVRTRPCDIWEIDYRCFAWMETSPSSQPVRRQWARHLARVVMGPSYRTSHWGEGLLETKRLGSHDLLISPSFIPTFLLRQKHFRDPEFYKHHRELWAKVFPIEGDSWFHHGSLPPWLYSPTTIPLSLFQRDAVHLLFFIEQKRTNWQP